MKETTQVRYETSDGTTFSNKRHAQHHELAMWAKEKLPKGQEKLTVPALLDVILEDGEAFAEKLGEVCK